MKTYRLALLAAGLIILMLAAVLVRQNWVKWRAAPRRSSVVIAAGPAAAAGPARSSLSAPPSAASPDSGAKLAPVHLSPATLQAIGVRLGTVAYGLVADTVRTVGYVAADQDLLSTVQVRFSGWVTHEFATQPYQFIRRGQPLVTLYSPELATSEEEYLLALRDRRLLQASSVPGVASGARSLVAASRRRLAQWQVPARTLARLARTGRAQREVTVDAPSTGYIMERRVLPNGYVRPGQTIYTVAGLSKVWVNVQVFQNDAGRVRVGQPAAITVDAYPGEVFSGRVAVMEPVVNAGTRTVPARLVLANPRLRLLPGMFVNAVIHVPLGRRLTVPAGAVLQTGSRNIAFVDEGGGYLRPVNVTLGPQVGDAIIVLHGLQAGQRVVASANFLIASESQLQAALGGFVPPPPGARGQAAPRARIEFAVQPSPPRKGVNAVRVRLTGAGGRSITGARVTVSFFMPAMPAMGMPAAHASATLAASGGGYAGSITLPSGGNWQVAVSASKNGTVLATRQFNLTAEP